MINGAHLTIVEPDTEPRDTTPAAPLKPKRKPPPLIWYRVLWSTTGEHGRPGVYQICKFEETSDEKAMETARWIVTDGKEERWAGCSVWRMEEA